ncbi:MAG TPA: hypothetical protein VJ900_02010 [Patescibacteria group bacterium]|nr:hypothetical protein [Patescibacteria group bacterium]
MTLQNLFYATSSITTIIIGILFIAIAIIVIIIAVRLAKFSRKISLLPDQADKFLKNIQQKIKYSTIITLLAKILKVILDLLKKDKKKKNKDK